MKILLTGATGTIGTRLCLELARKGHKLVLLSRNPDRAKQNTPVPCEAFAWDALKEAAPAEAFGGVEGIIHLAGEPVAGSRWTSERKRRIMESRREGTQNLLKGIPDPSKIGWMVSASAIGFYGDRGEEELTEDSAQGENFFLGEVCREWEKETLENSILSSARRVALRIGVVLEDGGGALDTLVPLFRTGGGGPLGSGKQWMSWIHVVDLVRMLVHAAEDSSWNGIYNAVAPEPATNKEFTSALSKALGVPAVVPAPQAAVKLAAGEMAMVVLASQRVIPKRALAGGFKFKHADLEASLDDLVGYYKHGYRKLTYRQWVPKKKEDIFPFFSDPKNLETITPPILNFKVLDSTTEKVESGTLIRYKLKLRGLPMKWKTLIDEWQPPHRFVDEQLKGPYDKWRHLHTFEDIYDGTLLEDHVTYGLPLGWLGRTVAGSFVRGDVGKIFEYRQEKIREQFGE
jgi:uncharacterized protein (TIGR01777 family)